MATNEPQPWSIIAQNLPEHARNPIHTDVGAQAAGFPRALVAGVTTYAYLTHPIVAAWGLDWLRGGGGEVRFRQPVFDQDLLRCLPVADGDGVIIQGHTAESDRARLILRAVRGGGPIDPRPGEVLPILRVVLGEEFGCDYGVRAGDDFDFYSKHSVVHPAVWPALANQVVHAHVARGSWVHTRSIIRHLGLAHPGQVAEVHAVVVRRFEAHGQRAVLDVRIAVDGDVVALLEHEAIVCLPGASDES